MKELKIEIPEGYEIDKENSSFEKIVFKKKVEVNCWEDLKRIQGAFITEGSLLNPVALAPVLPHNRNIFLNKKYAKSALALAQISQLLPYYDTNVDWTSRFNKFCICCIGNKIEIIQWIAQHCILAFNSQSEAERFLKYNKQLVKDFYML